MIEINNISKVFRTSEVETVALNHVNLEVKEGEFVAIMGPSGCGKSTLLNILGLLDNPTEGSYRLMGEEVGGLKEKERTHVRKGKLGFVFQSFNLFNNMTVLENCMVGQVKVLKKGKEESKQKAMYYLEKVGMAPYINAKPRQLSGGQKQRVAIAGVMAMRPRCIILDEPTAMLDPNGRKEVLEAVRELNRKEKVTVILITHYMEEVIHADRVYVMDSGNVVMQGNPKEIFSQVDTLKKYGLDVPQVTLLAYELKKSGVDVPDGILTTEELVSALCQSN